MASQSGKTFEQIWRTLPSHVRWILSQKELNGCRTWARLVDGEDEPEAVVLDTVQGLCGDLYTDEGDLDEHSWEGYLSQLMSLAGAARAPAERIEGRVARTTDLQISVEQAERKRRREEALETTEHSRLQVYSPPEPGRDWKPIKYRRGVAIKPESERADQEALERTRWSREVLAILAEADLPFARTTGGSGSTVDLRCCLGLRARTLAKRVRDWRPFRRYLLAQGHGAFPTAIGQVLAYMEAKAIAGASISSYKDLQAALRFVEQAGERESGDLLFSHPALGNAVREGKAAPDDCHRTARRGRQAPPMLIALIASIERVVIASGPSFIRLYAWYRLVRHWCCFRFDDTMGIRPDLLRPQARGISGILDSMDAWKD